MYLYNFFMWSHNKLKTTTTTATTTTTTTTTPTTTTTTTPTTTPTTTTTTTTPTTTPTTTTTTLNIQRSTVVDILTVDCWYFFQVKIVKNISTHFFIQLYDAHSLIVILDGCVSKTTEKRFIPLEMWLLRGPQGRKLQTVSNENHTNIMI